MCKCSRGCSCTPKYLVKITNEYGFHKKNEQAVISKTEYELHKEDLELLKKIEDINELSIIK